MSIMDIEETASGDIVLAGYFNGIVDLDPGPGVDIHEEGGWHETFIVKLDPNGGFKWAKSWTAGGDEFPQSTPAIAIDPDDNIRVTHEFMLLTDLDPGPGIDVRYSSGGTDVFISKFDPDGNYISAITWGGLHDDIVDGMLIDHSNSIWVGGRFGGTVDFDPGPGVDEHTAAPEPYGSYLSRFDLEGDYLGVQIWDQDWPMHDIACDDFNNVYFGGTLEYYEGGTDFDPGPKTEIRNPPGPSDQGQYLSDAFLVKTPQDGNWW
jgi:hypothetical protein